jgi:hypothetical protein
VKSTGYPLHSPVSPSLPLPASLCAITFQLESTTWQEATSALLDIQPRLASRSISKAFHLATQISNLCSQVNSLAYAVLYELRQIRLPTGALYKKCRSLGRVPKDRGFENPLGAVMSGSVYLKPLQLSDSPRSTLTAGICKTKERKHRYSSQRLGSASSPHSFISR